RMERRDKVAEHEAVARDGLADLDRDGGAEHRAGAGEGVELAVLGTGVDAGRKVRKQGSVETPAGKAFGQLARIDAGHVSLEPTSNHAARERAGLDPPQGEQRHDT